MLKQSGPNAQSPNSDRVCAARTWWKFRESTRNDEPSNYGVAVDDASIRAITETEVVDCEADRVEWKAAVRDVAEVPKHDDAGRNRIGD